MNLEERVDLLEFQVELLFNNADIDRFLYESKITRSQYRALMDLMEEYRKKIGNGESVNHGTFETEIYGLVPEKNGDYHFCELFAKLLMENGRWDEVFPALYGDMTKYKGISE